MGSHASNESSADRVRVIRRRGSETRSTLAPGDIYNLGTLGGTYSSGYGINDAGQVAGYSSTTGDAARPRLPLHRHARQRRRHARPGHPRRDGQLRLRHQRRRAGRREQPARPATRLPRLPLHRHARQRRRRWPTWAPSAGTDSYGYAINDAGQVAGDPATRRRRRCTPSATPARPAAAAPWPTWAPSAGRAARLRHQRRRAGRRRTASIDRRRRHSRLPLHRHARQRRRDGRPGHPRRDGQRRLRHQRRRAGRRVQPDDRRRR